MGALGAILERQDELLHHGLGKQLNTDMAVSCQAPRCSQYPRRSRRCLRARVSHAEPQAGCRRVVFGDFFEHAVLFGAPLFRWWQHKPPSVTGRTDTTSSEMRVASKLAELYLQSITEAFKEKVTFETEVIDMQNNLDALEERVATEKYLALVTDVTTSDFEDALRLFVPFESFESLEDTLAGPKQESGISLESEWQARIAEQMQDVAIEVSGVLASIELPLREVLGLKVGDVVDLAQLGSVSLEVQNQSVGFGQFGVFDDKKSVKYGMTGLLDLGAGVTLSSAIDQALNEEADNE